MMRKTQKTKNITPASPLAPVRAFHPMLVLSLRALVAALLVCGLDAFICEAFMFDFRIEYVLVCLISCELFALMSYSRRLFVVGAVGIVAAAGGLAVFSGDPLRRLALALDALVTGIMNRLSDFGFNAYSPFDLGVNSVESGSFERDLVAAITIASILLCAVICACTLRRVTLILPAFVVTAILGYVFIYNLSRSSWPLVIVVSACAGILAMRICDGKRQRESASGGAGFAGIAAALVSAVVLCPAAVLIKEPAPVIPVIDEGMQYARAMVSSVIMGDLPAMLELGFSGYMETMSDRSTEANDRVFSGKEIMTIQAGLPSTVYMRSWVGVEYSENSWKTADNAKVMQWRVNFGEDFTPELLTERFFELIDPSLTKLTTISSSRDQSEHGFISTFVDVSTEGSSGNLLALPSRYDAFRGFMEAGARNDESYTAATNSYFDGIFTTEWTNFNRNYRTLAHLPTFASPDYETTILRDFEAHSTVVNMVERYFNLGERPATLLENYAGKLSEFGITDSVKALLEKIDAMSADEREQWYRDYIELPALYGEYVNENYISTGDEDEWLDIIRDGIIEKIIDENSLKFISIDNDYRTLNIERQHLLAMSVMEYLRDNCVYTLTPREPSLDGYSSLRTFLEDTREGYCVQFATSAVLLLRSMGIPARYVEGYVADDFTRNNADDRNNFYIATVHDYNAHAWVEVYYEGYGWMQYEATPPYMSGMYDKTGSASTLPPETQTPETPETEPITDPDEDPDEEEDGATEESGTFPFGILIAAIVLIAVILLVLFIRKSLAVREGREALIERAIYGAPSGEVLLRVSRDVIDEILSVLSVLGLEQQRGELPLDFAARVDAAFRISGEEAPLISGGPPSTHCAVDVFALIEHSEFGSGMSTEELSVCGEYLRDIHRFAYKNAGIFKKFYLCYVKRRL